RHREAGVLERVDGGAEGARGAERNAAKRRRAERVQGEEVVAAVARRTDDRARTARRRQLAKGAPEMLRLERGRVGADDDHVAKARGERVGDRVLQALGEGGALLQDDVEL